MIRGVTFGTFDLLHAGHVMFLSQCKAQCDYLTVGLHIDPHLERFEKNTPIQSVLERFIQLESLECVNYIIPYEIEKDLDFILHFYKFDKRFLGSDYSKDYTLGKVGSQKTCKDIGTEIVFINRFHNFSSTELRNRIKENDE